MQRLEVGRTIKDHSNSEIKNDKGLTRSKKWP